MKIQKKIKLNGVLLKDYCKWEPKVWVKTWLNDFFILNKEKLEVELLNLNEKIYKPIIFWKNVKQYSIVESENLILFPYNYINWELDLIDLKQYPEAEKYFKKTKKD